MSQANQMNQTVKKAGQVFGWIWVFVFVMIGVLGAGMHIIDHFTLIGDNPAIAHFMEENIYGKEFFQHWLSFRHHPESRMIHMVFGIAYVLIAPWQIIPKIRKSYPKLHRIVGRTSLILSFALVATGISFAYNPYTYTGFQEQVPTITYSLIYAWIIFMAVKSILAHDIKKHREWMIRGFFMMMGISATRVWFYAFLKLTDIPSPTFFASIFWLGLGVNLALAEIWINVTREEESTKRETNWNDAEVVPLTLAKEPSGYHDTHGNEAVA